jgi:Xaa-Pro aminopeptidase
MVNNQKGGTEMSIDAFERRLQGCGRLMKAAGLDVLLLTKPSNMFYLTGDGRLCAYAMITRDGKVALGVPQTDVEDVKKLARFDHLVGFEAAGNCGLYAGPWGIRVEDTVVVGAEGSRVLTGYPRRLSY